MKPSMVKCIAVIGGGSSGLAATKACKEEGFSAVCFERSGGVGGLWNYGGDHSTMSFTVINTHKEMSAFSDFPPPAHLPNYMHHSQVLRYFARYAEHFDLLPCVRFRREVLAVRRSEDYAQTGRWKVRVRHLDSGEEEEETFDGVMVCTGHHARPSLPSGVAGLDAFGGTVLHSQALKHADAFRGKEVLVVGIGNSGVDAAVEISHVAKQVYLSTRSGSWVVPRSGPYGLPMDTLFSNRFVQLCMRVLGWKLISLIAEALVVNQFFDHSLYGLRPKHRLLSQHPTINDALPSKILSGRVLVRGDVERFTERAVVFRGGGEAVPLDAVVFATGYKVELPFVDFLNPVDNQVDLYKLTFPPSLEHPTFALIGMTQPLGCIFPIAEAQSRWFCQLMAGKCRLPCLRDMRAEVQRRRRAMQERYAASPRHTLQVDYTAFMDDITSEFGARPDMLRLLRSDPRLFVTCLFGPCLPYQYRLQGPHACPERARELLLTYPSRVVSPLKSGLTPQRYSNFEFFRIFNLVPVVYLLPLLLILVCLVVIF